MTLSITALVTLLIWLVLLWLVAGLVIWVASEVAPSTAGVVRRITVALCGVLSLLLVLGLLAGVLPAPHVVLAR